MRAKDLVYHVECFACYACGAVLCKGDYYGVRDGAVFCRPDYERLKHRDMACELRPMCSPPRVAGHHWPSAHKGRPRKKKNGVQQLSPVRAAAECNGLAELNVLRIPQSTLGTFVFGRIFKNVRTKIPSGKIFKFSPRPTQGVRSCV